MSRETVYTTDHWHSAQVVQELGWRPWLARLPRPRWPRRKAEAASRTPGEARLLVLFDVLNCVFLAWVASLLGLSRMSDGSMPWEWLFPATAAVSAGVLTWVKGLRWPPVPEWERFPNPTVSDGKDKEKDAEDAGTENAAAEVDSGRVKVWEVLLVVLVLPALAVAALALFVSVFVARLALFVVRRGWPALAVTALVAAVSPYASADGVGFTLFATGVLAMLFNFFLVWPLQRWCGLPIPDLRRKSVRKNQVWRER